MTTQKNQPKKAISRAQKAKILAHCHQATPFELAPLSEDEFMFLKLNLEFGVEPEQRKTFDEVDGFLNALAVGPIRVTPDQWLPVLLGPTWSKPPNVSMGKRIYNLEDLLIRCLNIIVADLRRKPQVTRVYWTEMINESDGKTCYDATDWARGFSEVVRWRWKDWLPLIRSPQGDQLLGAIALLGLKGCHVDQEKLTSTVAMRSELSTRIYYTYPSIYTFWHGMNAM